MEQFEFIATLGRIVKTLDGLEIRYHLTGGLVSSFYGEPRLTQDIDFVLQLEPEKIDDFVELLGTEFLIDPEVVTEAVRCNRLFQALDQETFIKVDFHVGEKIPGEFQRSVVRELFDGLTVPMASKGDAIMSKLMWIKQGSHKSRQDIVGMILDPTPVDVALLEELAAKLGVLNLWKEISAEAEKLKSA